MEMLTVVRTCRPEKPGVGLTRQSRCPKRTYAYYKEAALERDIHWFNWQLRRTLFHVKNYRQQRKQWIYFLQKLWIKYRMCYNVITCEILSFLPYDKLPHPRIERPMPIGAYDNLEYETVDPHRVCQAIASRLGSLGYPVHSVTISIMDVYLSYYSSSNLFPIDMDEFRAMYQALEARKVPHKWRIIASHMLTKGGCASCYNYSEGYLHKNYLVQRADHYFRVWTNQVLLTGEARLLAEAWFARMKRPSLRKPGMWDDPTFWDKLI